MNNKNKNKSMAASRRNDAVISKKGVIVISAVALVLVAALTLGIVFSVIYSRDINYIEDNLSLYISLSEEDYKGYTVEVLYDEMSESDVERKIMSLRYQKRKGILNNGGNIINLNQPVKVGDMVKIFYRGYTMDDAGVQTDFAGGCNFTGSAHSLEIGSLGFIPGFEESIVGVKPNDYSKLSVKKTGTVSAGDVIYLTYKAMLPDGSSVTKTSERIDLSSADVDARYGAGFAESFNGATIGKTLSNDKTFTLGAGTAVYFDMKIDYATTGEDNPLTINAYFPADYRNDPSLRGKTVFFDVFFTEVIAYDTPEYNDTFILETLGVSEETLSKYEGSTIVEKHKNMLREQIAEEYASKKKPIIENAVWEHLHEVVKIKRLPQNQVDDEYYKTYNEIEIGYSYYSYVYSSIDEFAVAYLGIADGTNWKEYIRKNAEGVIKEKLIFYYIVREENLLPDDAEYEKRYNEIVQEYLEYHMEQTYKDELAAIKTEAEREKKIAEIKEEMLDFYGEEYFSEIVYYEYSLDAFLALANVTKK